eukprot:11612943-Heterocapsa_arctica.AAC.1
MDSESASDVGERFADYNWEDERDGRDVRRGRPVMALREGEEEATAVGGVSEEDWGSKLLNLREIAKPPTFDGQEKHWPDFRFKFEA